MKVKKTKKTSRKVDAADVAPGRVEKTINKSPAKPILEAMNKPTNNGSTSAAVKKQVQQNGITFEPKVEKKIAELEKALIKSREAAFEIGKICDGIIADIGLDYGKGTFRNLAIKTGCNERYLRRCWDFYRLMNNPAYKTEDTKWLRENKPYAIFELGRIMREDLPEEKKQELITNLAKNAVAEKWTVAEMATHVKNELKRYGKWSKKVEAKKEPEPETPIEMEVRGQDLIDYADIIKKYVSPERIKSGALEDPSEWKGYRRLVDTVVEISKTIMCHVCDNDLGDYLIEKSKQLGNAGEVIKIGQNKAA